MADALKRHFDILKMLSKDRPLKTSDIHERLRSLGHDISKRTVERDLQHLSTQFPIYADDAEHALCWRYVNDVAIHLFPGLSEAEAVSFIVLQQFAQQLLPESLSQDLQPYFQEAKRTLSSSISKSAIKTWPTKIRSVSATQPLINPPISKEVLKNVHAALLSDQQASIRYQAHGKNEAKEYCANLLGLVERGSVHYLVVTIEPYQEVRMLVMHRIVNATVLDTSVKKPESFSLDAYINSGAFGFGSPQGETLIHLRFFNGAGNALKETPLARDQVVTQVDNYTIEVNATVRDDWR
ncbi:MAG: WYL domain-containing protein, partial [Undibacterium sp.]|nr:WYL domain-containing protein [Undibacterium sp.]